MSEEAKEHDAETGPQIIVDETHVSAPESTVHDDEVVERKVVEPTGEASAKDNEAAADEPTTE